MLQIRKKNSDKGPLWLVETQYSVGNGANCDIRVATLPAAEHAHLFIEGDSATIVNLKHDASIRVNGKVVETRQTLSAGDNLYFAGEEYELIDPKSSLKASEATSPVADQEWSLKALNTGLADKQFPITGSHILGRSKECDICLGVVHLSRQHAKITVTENGLQVQDLNSSNGTYVNGKKVEAALVQAGDELSFDTLRFRVFGPPTDEDKTVMRPDSNENLTTIRPAVNVAAPSTPKKTSASRNHAARRKPVRSNADVITQPASTATSSNPKAEAKSSNVLIIMAVIAVLIGSGVAWFMLK